MIWLPVICNGLTYFPPGQIRMWYTEQSWFTEPCTECGTALSFEIHKKLHEEQTPFQTIEIYSTKSFGKMMAIDGFVMLTERDNFIYHEMLAHPVLFTWTLRALSDKTPGTCRNIDRGGWRLRYPA